MATVLPLSTATAISALRAAAQDGIFHADTRYLSRFELLLNGRQPLLLGSNLRDDNSVLTIDLTNPDIYFNGQLALPKDTIHIVRTVFLWRGCAYHRFDLHNHGDARLAFSISLTFDNDFADLFEVRGLHRARRGKSEMTCDPAAGRADIVYQGLDGARAPQRADFRSAAQRAAQ